MNGIQIANAKLTGKSESRVGQKKAQERGARSLERDFSCLGLGSECKLMVGWRLEGRSRGKMFVTCGSLAARKDV